MATSRTLRQRMPIADAAWLHMGRPTNLTVINAVWLFDEPLELSRLREVLQRRLVTPYPRFRQRVVEGRLPLAGAHWEDDPTFDIEHHLHRRGLAAPGDEAALQALIGDLMGAPLDQAKPLWDMYLIDGPGDGCALFMRVHHCVADGIALARVMLSLADSATDGEADEQPPRVAGPDHGALGALIAPATSIVSASRAGATVLAHEGLHAVAHPRHLAELVRSVERETAALIRLVFLPADADTSLRGELGTSRRVAWTAPLELERIKTIARTQEATVNDVLLAAVSGALRRHLLSRGERAPRLRAIVPFNLRPADLPIPRELGNRFGLVFLDLPVDVSDRRRRLRAVKDGMDAIKRSPDGPLTYAVLQAMGAVPSQIESRAVDLFSAKGTAVMTNVPGPRQPIHLAGSHVQAVLVWAPASGSVGMSVSILSYQGQVTVGLMVDAHVVPEPRKLAHQLEREIAALARLQPARRSRREAADATGAPERRRSAPTAGRDATDPVAAHARPARHSS